MAAWVKEPKYKDHQPGLLRQLFTLSSQNSCDPSGEGRLELVLTKNVLEKVSTETYQK